MEEKRKNLRIPFSPSDAIFGILKKENSGDEFVTSPILDISEEGLKFSLNLNYKKELNVHEKLYLKEITGTRNVLFDQPIELLIKWKSEEKSELFIGCELIAFTKEAKRKFSELVNSEKVFNENLYNARLKNSKASKDSKEHNMIPEKNKIDHYYKYIFITGFILLILSFAYSYRVNMKLAERIQQMETRVQNLSDSLYSGKLVKEYAQVLDERIVLLFQQQRQIANDLGKSTNRIDALEKNILKTDKRSLQANAPEPKVLKSPGKTQKENIIHVVSPGDNLFRISLKYNVLLEKLAEYNNLRPNDIISPGQKIKIPSSERLN